MSYNFNLIENLSKPLKVSELVAKLKADVEKNHKNIKVVGEISSFKQWRSGHCYFDIKDEGATLPAIIFQPHFARLGFAVSDGQQMLFSGRATIYQANSRLQMIVEAMEPLGQGALALAFEQLKAKLDKEGLFDAAYKKRLRPYNFWVGLITSSHGAVLKDMVRILQSRMPKVDISLVSVKVQGTGAAFEIKSAIELLDNSGCDLIIVGRGGGSLEDLQAFNDEAVARAIFKAKTLIISAVGHETDFSISDFVADVRAATPTHAATLAVPKLLDLLNDLELFSTKLEQNFTAKLKNASLGLAFLKQRLKDPRILLFRHWQEVDEKSKELSDRFRRLFFGQKNQLVKLKSRLLPLSPHVRLRLRREALYQALARIERLNPRISIKLALSNLSSLKMRMHDQARFGLLNQRQEFQELLMKLHALSPLGVLARGYSLVESLESKEILRQKDQFYVGQHINIRVEDGLIRATVIAKE